VNETPVSSNQVAIFATTRSWITAEFLEETKAVWSKAYGREVSDDEAIEILSNVKRFSEVLIHIQKG
jgi:hypothetical protein